MTSEPKPKTYHRVTSPYSCLRGSIFEDMEHLPLKDGEKYLRTKAGSVFHESELEEVDGLACDPPTPRYRLHVTIDFSDHYAVIKDDLDGGRVVATVHTIEDSQTVLNALNQHDATQKP